jgi:hypothetical protein
VKWPPFTSTVKIYEAIRMEFPPHAKKKNLKSFIYAVAPNTHECACEPN